jgi:hypothetical protein
VGRAVQEVMATTDEEPSTVNVKAEVEAVSTVRDATS